MDASISVFTTEIWRMNPSFSCGKRRQDAVSKYCVLLFLSMFDKAATAIAPLDCYGRIKYLVEIGTQCIIGAQ